MTVPSAELLALQDIDSEIDALVHRRRHLPERARVDEDVTLLEAMRHQAVECRVELDELTQKRVRAESELALTDARRGAIAKRLYSAQTTSTRDLQAMQAETGSLDLRASSLEDEVLGLLEAADAVSGRLGELDRGIASVGESLLGAAEELNRAETDIDGRIAGLRARREAAKAAISASLLGRYEQLRARLGGVAVARVVGRRCSGCHLTLSAMELEQVRRSGDGDVYTCEQCSRMLVVERGGE